VRQADKQPCNRGLLTELYLAVAEICRMSARAPSPPRTRFGSFELDLASGELFNDGQKVALPPIAFGVLKALMERPGEVVTREELRARLWDAETFVEFNDSLNHAVNKLRRAGGTRPKIPGSSRLCLGSVTASLPPVPARQIRGRRSGL